MRRNVLGQVFLDKACEQLSFNEADHSKHYTAVTDYVNAGGSEIDGVDILCVKVRDV
jgi:hypothetical protein